MADYATGPGGHCLAHGNYGCEECRRAHWARYHTVKSQGRTVALLEAIARKLGVDMSELDAEDNEG